MAKKDFLDEIIEERTERNPEFPQLVEAAARRREFLRKLAAHRQAKGLSQTAVAAAMDTSQSQIARLEGSADDAHASTLDRFALTLGYQVDYRLVPIEKKTRSRRASTTPAK
jgi:hypothetical protein